MSMLTLQILALILLFGLVGALVGWLIRPLFCKAGATNNKGHSSRLAGTDPSIKSAARRPVDTTYARGEVNHGNKDSGGRTAAAVGVAAAATAAVVSSKNKMSKAEKQALIDADKQRLIAQAKSARNVERDMKDEALAAKAVAARAAATKLAEENCIAEEKAKANQAARAAAIEADRKQLAAEGQAARQAAKDATDSIAAKKIKVEQAAKEAARAKADRIAAEKAKAEQAVREAASAEADRISAEKVKAEQAVREAASAEADRIAAEKVKAEQAARDAAANAEVNRVTANRVTAEHKAQVDQAVKEAAARADKASKDAAVKPNLAKLAAAAAATTAVVASNANTDDEYASVTDDMRPEQLTAPRGSNADNLQRINGIGPVIEERLNAEGVYHFQQIANFTPDNVKWVDKRISFPGRVTREEWIRQAKELATSSATSPSTNNASANDLIITEAMRPTRRAVESGERADNLKAINGIGPMIESSLNQEGIFFYQQIADFDENNARWVDNKMAFPGRIHRENWIGQAKALIAPKGSRTVTRTRGSGTAQTVKSIVGSSLGSSGAVPDAMKPALLSMPEGGKADNLKRIKGIGKVLERNFHEMGIYHYEQLAALTPDNIRWITDYMSFPEGRIDNEQWTSQARALIEGKQTEYSQRFDKGDTPYK